MSGGAESGRQRARAGLKHVLFVHYHFLPVHNVAVKRLVGYAQELPSHGWRASVLTREWSGTEDQDPSWGLSWEPELEERIDCHICRVPDPSASARVRRERHPAPQARSVGTPRLGPGAVERILAKVGRIGRLMLGRYPDEFIEWARPAIEAGVRIGRRDSIDLIMSYCPPATNHVVARELAVRLKVPWVPFFGDLYGFLDGRFPSHSVEGLLQRRWHQWCLAPAAACIGVSPAMVRHLEDTYRKRADIVLTGFDPDDFLGALVESAPRDRFIVSHIGSVYPGDQRPELFLDGLDRLLMRNPEIGRCMEVRFVGSKCDDLMRQMLNGRLCAGVCSVRPKVDSRMALSLVRESDVLLALTCSAHRDRHGTLSYPTKIFEAFGARRPILAVPADGDFVDDLLMATNGGTSARDAEHVADLMGEWFAIWSREGRVPFSGRQEEIAKFTRRRQVERLCRLFDSVCER